MKENRKPMFGYYSISADERFGHSVYETANGELRNITCIADSHQWVKENYLWEDKVFVSEVVSCVQINNHPAMNLFVVR